MKNVYHIGNVIQSPHDTVVNETGEDVFSLLPCEGEVVSEATHPLLFSVAEPSHAAYSGTIMTIAYTRSLFSDGEFYYIGGNGYVYKKTSDWTAVKTITNTGASGKYIRGVCSAEDVYPGYIYTLTADSDMKIRRVSVANNSVADSVSTGLDARGIFRKGSFLYIGSGKVLYEYSLDLTSTGRTFDVLDSVEALSVYDGYLWISTISGCYKYTLEFDKTPFSFVRPDTTYYWYGGVIKDILNENGFIAAQHTNGVLRNITLSPARPKLTSKDPRVPFKIIADLT